MKVDPERLRALAKRCGAVGLFDAAEHLMLEAIDAEVRSRSVLVEPAELLSLSEWHRRHAPHVDIRTVRRWCTAGLLTGSERSESGRWSVPADTLPPE